MRVCFLFQTVPNSKGEQGKDKSGGGEDDQNHVTSLNGGVGGNFERRGRGRGRGGSTTDRGKTLRLNTVGTADALGR